MFMDLFLEETSKWVDLQYNENTWKNITYPYTSINSFPLENTWLFVVP